jgi:hypothetical protein
MARHRRAKTQNIPKRRQHNSQMDAITYCLELEWWVINGLMLTVGCSSQKERSTCKCCCEKLFAARRGYFIRTKKKVHIFFLMLSILNFGKLRRRLIADTRRHLRRHLGVRACAVHLVRLPFPGHESHLLQSHHLRRLQQFLPFRWANHTDEWRATSVYNRAVNINLRLSAVMHTMLRFLFILFRRG